MPTLREDLIPVVDSIRREIVDQAAGLRLEAVVVRRRTWSGGQPGLGTATDEDVVLDPVPKVRPPEPRLRSREPGKFEDGDLVVDKVSLTHTRDVLDGGTLPIGTELYWLIGKQVRPEDGWLDGSAWADSEYLGPELGVAGEPYRVVSLDEGFLGWTVHLRRMRRRT